MNKYHSLLLTTALLLGSAQLSAAEIYPLYVPATKSVITSSDIMKIENGQLQFHGKKIFDEDGNIGMAFNINNKLFYFTTKESADNATYILKDENGKEIRKFEGARIRLLSSEDGLPLILVQIQARNNKYDNVYKFDGQDVKLINKNFQQKYNEFFGAGCQIIPLTYGSGSFAEEYEIKSVSTDELKVLNTLHPTKPMFASPNPKRMSIVTTAGANIIYTYKDSDDNYIIETYNTSTGEQKVIAREKGVFQFWYAGDKKLLRIIKDKSLSPELKTTYSDSDPIISKYDDAESVFLDLTSLNEVTVNPKDFKKVLLQWSSGGVTFHILTFDLRRNLDNTLTISRKGLPLF